MTQNEFHCSATKNGRLLSSVMFKIVCILSICVMNLQTQPTISINYFKILTDQKFGSGFAEDLAQDLSRVWIKLSVLTAATSSLDGKTLFPWLLAGLGRSLQVTQLVQSLRMSLRSRTQASPRSSIMTGQLASPSTSDQRESKESTQYGSHHLLQSHL